MSMLSAVPPSPSKDTTHAQNAAHKAALITTADIDLDIDLDINSDGEVAQSSGSGSRTSSLLPAVELRAAGSSHGSSGSHGRLQPTKQTLEAAASADGEGIEVVRGAVEIETMTGTNTAAPTTTSASSSGVSASVAACCNDGTFHTAQQEQQPMEEEEEEEEEEQEQAAVVSNTTNNSDAAADNNNHDDHDDNGYNDYDYNGHEPPAAGPDGAPILPAPPVRMQRRRSSLGHTACAEIGEAAAEHLQTFLQTTRLERTDSGNQPNRRSYSGDDADALCDFDAYDHNGHNDRGALVDHPERVAPERSQTASPTLPGQTQASYKQYIDMYDYDTGLGLHVAAGRSGHGMAVERSASASVSNSDGANRRSSNGSHVSSSRSRSQHSSSDSQSQSHSQSNPSQQKQSPRCYLPVRTFHMDEIVVGRLLGSGTFNDVYEAFLVPRRQLRPVYGRQASLPSSIGRERERRAPTLAAAGSANAPSTAASTAASAQAQVQDAPSASASASASYQPTYGQMALNDEPPAGPSSSSSSGAIRRRPSSTANSHPNSHSHPSEPRYVLKHLKDVVMEDYDTFLTGAVDLAVEAKMLSHLHHPNIIRLEGVTAGSLSDALSTGIVGGYFLVLEMLQISLLEQIVKWAEEKKVAKQRRRPSIARLARSLSSRSLDLFQGDNDSKGGSNANGATAITSTIGDGDGGEDGSKALPPRRMPRRRSSGASSSFRSFFDSEEDQSTAAPPLPSRPAKEPMFLYHRRLTVAAEIAAGFAYLHRKNILYRDAKPQNIGLDHNGTVKIFDMGLAKELHEGDKRKHTGNCGTKRYMSPECGRFDHYGLSSDVYSFSLLLWEILALERPYAKLTAKDFSEKVYFGSMRPTIPSKWPSAIRELLPDCWTNEKNERPTMETVANVLRNMAAEAESLRPAYGANTSSRSLNDGMSDITSVASEAPSTQGAVAGGKARPGMLRRPSMTRGSFRLGGSSRSLVGGPSKVSNEGVVVPKNIRKWLEEQEKKESDLDSETLRVARTGGARAAARRNPASINKRPDGESIEQQGSFQDSQELHDPLAKSTGDNDRRVSYGSASTGSNPVADPGAEAHLRRGSNQSSVSAGAMMFPARSISRRASTRYF